MIVEGIYSETYIKFTMKGVKSNTKFKKAGKEVGCMIIVLWISLLLYHEVGGGRMERSQGKCLHVRTL